MQFFKVVSPCLMLGLASLTVIASAQEKPVAKSDILPYKDASLPIADRVADLLPRMTLEAKVYQMTGGWCHAAVRILLVGSGQ